VSASQRLRSKLALAYPALAETTARLWADERVRDLYHVRRRVVTKAELTND
jgi:hypothetical protein